MAALKKTMNRVVLQGVPVHFFITQRGASNFASSFGPKCTIIHFTHGYLIRRKGQHYDFLGLVPDWVLQGVT